MQNKILKTFFLLSIFLTLPNPVLAASKYYDRSEQLAFSVPDCDATKAPGCKTFFIDSVNGNDSWDGLSASYSSGLHGPFKTISHATDRYTSRNTGGNVFKIKAGIYHEGISFNNATGNIDEDHRITIGPYGDGEVIIDGSAQGLVWAQTDANIFETPYDHQNYLGSGKNAPNAVIMDDDFRKCRPVQNYSDLNSFGQWYYDDAARKLYLYTGGDAPSSHDVAVVYPDRYSASPLVSIKTKYVSIYGLTIRYSGSYGIYGWSLSDGSPSDYLKIENCVVKNSGMGGILTKSSNAVVQKNLLYGNVLFNWPRGKEWEQAGQDGGWPPHFGMMGGNSLASGNISHDGGGEGISSVGDSGDIVEDNISYDNWSVNLYNDNAENTIFRRNISYCTPADSSSIIDTNLININAPLNTLLKRINPYGLVYADETYTHAYAHSYGLQLNNNLILGCRGGITSGDGAPNDPVRTNPDEHNIVIANNTIVTPAAVPAGVSNMTGLSVPAWQKMTYENNVIQTFSNASSFLVSLSGTTMPTNTVMNNNLFYAPAGSTQTYHSGSYPNDIYYDFSGWKSFSSLDANSSFADPLFSNSSLLQTLIKTTPYADIMSAAELQSSSPAKDAGADLSSSGITYDFFGNLRPAGSGYDVGAIEFGALPPAETDPPIILSASPSSVLAFNTTSTDVSVSTDENATCKYSLLQNQTFANMTQFTTTGGQSHSFTISTANGNSYNYYVKCADVFNNIDPDDYTISFSVASSSDSTPPTLSFLAPVGNLAAGTTGTKLSLVTSENATCRYSTNSNKTFAQMTDNFVTIDHVSYSAQISGLGDGNSYTYYVRCQDFNGNANTNNALITFQIGIQTTAYQQSLYWNAKSNTPDQTLSGTTIISTGTPTYVTGQDGTTSGARNLSINNNYIQFSKTNDFNWQSGRMTFYWNPTNLVTNDVFHFIWASGKELKMQTNSSGRLTISYDFDSGGTSWYTDGALVNNWYQVSVNWDLIAQTFHATVGNLVMSPLNTSPSWSVTPSGELLYFGRSQQYTIYDHSYIDELYFYNPANDADAPIISNVATSSITTSSATVSWNTTGEVSTSQIEYGLTNTYGQTTNKDDSLKNAHSQEITGLSTGTTYHFRVKSLDAAGNPGYSNDSTFTAAASSDVVAPTAPSGLSVQ